MRLQQSELIKPRGGLLAKVPAIEDKFSEKEEGKRGNLPPLEISCPTVIAEAAAGECEFYWKDIKKRSLMARTNEWVKPFQ